MNNPHNDPNVELAELKNLISVLETRMKDSSESAGVIVTEIERIKVRLDYLKLCYVETNKKAA